MTKFAYFVIAAMLLGWLVGLFIATDRGLQCSASCSPFIGRVIDNQCHCKTPSGYVRRSTK